MKNLVIMICMLTTHLWCMQLSAQVVVVDANQTLWMEYEGNYYDLGYRGVRQFMADRQLDDPAMHQQLLPLWNDLQRRQATSVGLGIVGLGLGMTMILAGGTGTVTTGSEGTGIIVAGAVVFLAGILGSVSIYPRRQDYMGFVSRHNIINKDRPIQLHFVPIAQDVLGPGVRMQF